MTSSISFAGCGFLMSYHVGVAMCLRQFAPELVKGKICSTSSGLLVAVSLICDIPLGVITTEILRITKLARSFTLRALDPRFNLHKCLEEVLRNHLPEDAHERASGRLFISLTRIYDNSNVILSEFRYREQLIKAILAGCFIPTYSGLVPAPFKGVRYIDGSVTNNQPVIDQNTVRVSPFSGEADICPASGNNCSHANLGNMVVEVTEENLGRFFRVFIPQDPATMIRLCQQGFDDALGYLQCNKKTVLAKSFFITSTFLVIERDCDSASSLREARTDDNVLDGGRRRSTKDDGGQWSGAFRVPWRDKDDEELAGIDSSALRRSQDVLKALNMFHVDEEAEDKDEKTTTTTTLLLPVDLIVANLKSIAGLSIETRAFQMRLPKYEPPLNATGARGHVSAYFRRYLLRPVTRILSEKFCEASRVVLEKVNKRVNVDLLSDLLVKRPEQSSAPEDIKLLKHILQMTSEQVPFEAFYYMEESCKIHVTELFDISDCEDTNLQTETERELNQMLEFDIDDWGDAEFGAGDLDFDVAEEEQNFWDKNMPNEDLFPSTDPGQSSLIPPKVQAEEEEGKDFQTEGNGDSGDEEPYMLSNMATKALSVSQEYNEMIFGTFRNFDDVDEFDEDRAGERSRSGDGGASPGEDTREDEKKDEDAVVHEKRTEQSI